MAVLTTCCYCHRVGGAEEGGSGRWEQPQTSLVDVIINILIISSSSSSSSIPRLHWDKFSPCPSYKDAQSGGRSCRAGKDEALMMTAIKTYVASPAQVARQPVYLCLLV
ncbi:unnamed protein product [Schistocephalus solidus]|uniref:Uncharacterized protein n=1 Tax=Schistocephalus solidus TaxID=70667 RepID=A0A183SNL8_SCHSO|nr:unnamed protein product [Schistocephalus solidus]